MATRIIGQGLAAPIPHLRIVARVEVPQPTAVLAEKRKALRDRAPLELERHPAGDFFNGTADALVAAGLCRRDQLPGEPGNPKVSTRFLGDRPLRRYIRSCRTDPGYLSICRSGKGRYQLFKSIPEEESDRRQAARDQALQKGERERQEARCQAAESRLAQERRARTAQDFQASLLGRIDRFRDFFNVLQRGEDLVYDWCLKQGDMQAALACLAGLEQAIRNVVPVRHTSAKVANLRVVMS